MAVFQQRDGAEQSAGAAPPSSGLYPPGRVVNKLIYCLLALFLGCIGMHRFYAGQIASGLLRLLFFWTGIPIVLGLWDFARALTVPSDREGNIPV